MRSNDFFSDYHPIVNFTYFCIVLGFTMFFMQPVCLLISLVCSVLYYYRLKGAKAVRLSLRFALPMLLLAAVINPAFNHQGNTVLCYLPTGNPLTLESILYGIAAGCMLAAVLLWFACYTEVMTSDKFVYLFGRIIPALSLILSMSLRFVPKFKAQFEQVRAAQAGIGRDTENGSIITRIKSAAACFSVMITWSLENAVETSDSMKSRGYGLKGRTAFSLYSFTERDKTALIWLLFCGVLIFSGSMSGFLYWRWFPEIRGITAAPMTAFSELTYLALCLSPLIIDYREDIKWKPMK